MLYILVATIGLGMDVAAVFSNPGLFAVGFRYPTTEAFLQALPRAARRVARAAAAEGKESEVPEDEFGIGDDDEDLVLLFVDEVEWLLHAPYVAAINFTDIYRDGMQSGPNIEETRKMAEAVRIPVVASGGVSSIDDIRRLLPLETVGVVGVITGRALYSGSLDLQEAIAEIDEEWDEKAQAIEPLQISLEKNDITVDEVGLLWLPIG